MIGGKKYYFFRLDPVDPDGVSEYRIAQSFVDLSHRFGASYLAQFRMIVQLNEVTLEHIRAIDEFLFQQIS